MKGRSRSYACLISCTLLLLLGAASPRRAWSDGPRSELSPFDLVINTNFTEIDLNGNGVPDLIRRFDAAGNVVESTFRDPWSKDGILEHTVVAPDLLTSTTVWSKGGRELEREERFFEPGGRVGERSLSEIRRISSTHKRIERYRSDDTMLVSEFTLGADKAWTLVSEAVEPSRRNLTEAQQHFRQAFGPCSGDVGGAWACRDRYALFGTGLDPHSLASSVLNAPAACFADSRSQVFRLENGFSVDLKSCSTIEAVSKIIASTGKAREMITGCLANINPRLALKLSQTLRNQWTEITCGGDIPVHAGADTEVGKPPIALREADPVRGSGRNAAYKVFSDLIFHELMHAAGLPGSPRHDEIGDPNGIDQTDPRQLAELADPVYGCQYMCLPPEDWRSQMRMTQELCRSCVNETDQRGGDHSDSDRRAAKYCPSYLSAASLARFNVLRYYWSWKKTCKPGDTSNSGCVKAAAIFKTHFPACKSSGIDSPACDQALHEDAAAWFASAEQQLSGQSGSRELQRTMCETGNLMTNDWLRDHADLCASLLAQ